jgi:predicted NBD/HSP70 family sugar kinase
MSNSQIGNSELISTVNSRLVLQAVRIMQPTYRAAVARQTGLKPATVTSIVNDLIDTRLLRETEVASKNSTRWGRPPLMLEVNSDVKRILAIDLEPDRIRVALTNLLAEPLVYREHTIDRFSSPNLVIKEILALCDQVLQGVRPAQVQGAGLSLPGLIDQEQGVLVSSTNMPQWRNVRIARMLSDQLRLPVRAERSIRLAALYEKWAHPDQQDRNVLIVSVRTGIGMCLMNRGELYAGNLGLDGEIGHTVIDVDGDRCECGNRGCLETLIGAPAICRHAQREMEAGRCRELRAQIDAGERLQPELIYRLARQGDPDSAGIVERVGTHLGTGIANMINLLAPHEVVICGSIDIAGDIVLEAIRRQIQQTALPRTRERVVIRLASQQEKLPLLGAAVLIAQEFFQLPTLRQGAFVEEAAIQRTNGSRVNRYRRKGVRLSEA